MKHSYYGQKLADHALEYVGVKQGSKKHREIVDRFNKIKPHGEVANYNSAWCAIFATVMLADIGYEYKEVPMSYNCGTLLNDAKKLGMLIESDKTTKAECGDFILYDWDDTTGSKSDNKGVPDHVGIIYDTDDDYYYVVEGNKGTSETCGKRQVARNGQYIRGFVHFPHRARRINELALKYAWKKGTDESKYEYKGGSANKAFRTAWNDKYPGKKNSAGCHQYVRLVLKCTGYATMPLTWDKLLDYMKKRFTSIKFEGTTKQLKAGDVMIYRRIDSAGKKHYHIWIVVVQNGKKMFAEANQSRLYAHINTSMSRIKKNYDKFWIFRAK